MLSIVDKVTIVSPKSLHPNSFSKDSLSGNSHSGNPLYEKSRGGIPFFIERVRCGFPSPAEDYREDDIDFNSYLVKHHAATFTVKVEGDSMIDAGIRSGDLLIVDRSIKPVSGMIIVAAIEGEFTVKTLIREKGRVWLRPGNIKYDPIEISEESDFSVWGVVTHIIHHCPT